MCLQLQETPTALPATIPAAADSAPSQHAPPRPPREPTPGSPSRTPGTGHQTPIRAGHTRTSSTAGPRSFQVPPSTARAQATSCSAPSHRRDRNESDHLHPPKEPQHQRRPRRAAQRTRCPGVPCTNSPPHRMHGASTGPRVGAFSDITTPACRFASAGAAVRLSTTHSPCLRRYGRHRRESELGRQIPAQRLVFRSSPRTLRDQEGGR